MPHQAREDVSWAVSGKGETAASAAAPAARCRNCLRRGSFIFEPPFTSFDHLVGAGEERGRHLEAERFADHAFVARKAALKDLTLDHLAKDRLHVCFRKRSQRLRANVSKGATAQSKRSDGCIIGCLDNCDHVVRSQCLECVLHVRSTLFRHAFECLRPFRRILDVADSLIREALPPTLLARADEVRLMRSSALQDSLPRRFILPMTALRVTPISRAVWLPDNIPTLHYSLAVDALFSPNRKSACRTAQEPTMPSFLDDRVDSDAILDDIRNIVEIESPSRNAAGVNRVLETIARSFEGTGAAWERELTTDSFGDILLVRCDPTRNDPGILVLSHMDTVHPVGTLASKLTYRREGDRIYGPGIYDMKGGADARCRGVSPNCAGEAAHEIAGHVPVYAGRRVEQPGLT